MALELTVQSVRKHYSQTTVTFKEIKGFGITFTNDFLAKNKIGKLKRGNVVKLTGKRGGRRIDLWGLDTVKSITFVRGFQPAPFFP